MRCRDAIHRVCKEWGDKGDKDTRRITHAPCPMPHDPCPIPF
ncbi:MAG: hypothetical protein V7L05_24720 [Nostoc sp.]